MPASTQTGLLFDVELLPGLGSGTSGHVYLYDNVDSEIDRVGWGEAINAESNRPVVLSTTKVIERKKDPTSGLLIDTDNNENDFFNSTMRSQYKVGLIYEILDMCKNIADIQLEVPSGYTIGGNGDCIPPPADVCSNLDGLQLTLPPGYKFDSNSNCQFDNCPNIDGLQIVVPDGYKPGTDSYCVLSLPILQITELLPNATGSDNCKEYIEIYNPSDDEADLSKYVLNIGGNGERFSFPNGSIIKPEQYMTFSNDDIKFNLVNTTGSVSLYSIDNQLISETEIYSNPNDGMAWALIGGLWQYTNQPTPGSLNIISLSKTDGEILTMSSLQPCAANQYRSTETGRCRNIASDVSGLSPCGEGQERNPETNRCRNIAGTMPKADYAPQKTSEQSNNAILW